MLQHYHCAVVHKVCNTVTYVMNTSTASKLAWFVSIIDIDKLVRV